MTELLVLMGGHVVGAVERRRNDGLVFSYERAWQNRTDYYPLSLSMPLSSREHGDDVIRPFMEGLLPDNDTVLNNWARRFHVSPRNPFALLTHMGEECAGAAQFVHPERVDALHADEGRAAWLTEAEVAERLRDLVEAHGTGRLAGDRGHFSLAGAQPKMPLLHEDGRWAIPSGATPPGGGSDCTRRTRVSPWPCPRSGSTRTKGDPVLRISPRSSFGSPTARGMTWARSSTRLR